MKSIYALASAVLLVCLPAISVAAEMTPESCTGGDKFHKAATRGDIRFIQSCLNAKTPVNTVEGNGWTALHAAAFNGQAGVVKLLLKAGADPALKDKNGKTPADLTDLKMQQYQAVKGTLNTPVKPIPTGNITGVNSTKADELAEALRFELNNYGPNSSSDELSYHIMEILNVEKIAAEAGANYKIKVKFKTMADEKELGIVVYEGKISENAQGHITMMDYGYADE